MAGLVGSAPASGDYISYNDDTNSCLSTLRSSLAEHLD